MRTSTPVRHTLTTLCLLAMLSCEEAPKPTETTKGFFMGDSTAVERAEQMFTAIGGTERWCELRSLYIKALHTEPQMTLPYKSEIWRATDRFEIVIEQQNDSFHVKAVVTKDSGIVRYYDHRDTFRMLDAEQLQSWEFDHDHNVYVLLHEIGCAPSDYSVRIDSNDRLAFYKDSTFRVSFGLDDQMRPHLFYHPLEDGSVVGSVFSHWGTDDGLVHSAGGHPLDSNFIYRTEIWKPSRLSMREAFGETIFEVP